MSALIGKPEEMVEAVAVVLFGSPMSLQPGVVVPKVMALEYALLVALRTVCI